ncbi:putative bifunctional diguanylate cyclase/phosphodiesterase [Methylomagnum sp.]
MTTTTVPNHWRTSRESNLPQSLLDSLDDVLWSLSPEGSRLLFISAAAERLYGHPPAAFLENPVLWQQVIHPDDRDKVSSALAAASHGTRFDLEYRIVRADGQIRWVRDRAHPFRDAAGHTTRIDGLITAIESPAHRKDRLNTLALYDLLTGLASRALCLDRLSQLIRRDSRAPFAVLVFDVDRFKHINDTLTYQAGDQLLRELATRLAELVPKANLARTSGDDFALVLADTGTESEIACFVHDTLLPALTRPILYDGQELRVGLKVGVACFPADGTDAATLLNNAELAHRGAQNAREPLLFFAEEMNQGAGEFLRVENKLRRASAQREFIAYYQPKLDLWHNRLSGVEALLRWRDPDNGLVLPGKIIPILEETGLILDVGRWMIEEAGDQYMRWMEQDPAPPCIAVNISPLQLSQRSFVADMEAAIKACDDRRGYLELEITESAIMHDVADNVRKLHAIREMGVEITVDDFGTGYSSLSYLTRLPLTRLKIDRSFIVDMTESADSLSIVSSIISLAHTLNLKVAAEGVETPEQLKFLKLLRCDEIQGYLYSPPVTADEALRFKARPWR